MYLLLPNVSSSLSRLCWSRLDSDTPLAISAVTTSELLHGVHRAVDPHVVRSRTQFVNYILEEFPVVPFDLDVAHTHAKLWAALKANGNLIGAPDLIIAATAVTLEYGIITQNTRGFKRIPTLTILDPLNPAD